MHLRSSFVTFNGDRMNLLLSPPKIIFQLSIAFVTKVCCCSTHHNKSQHITIAFCRMENFKILAKVFFSFLEIRNVGNLNSLSILETERDVVTVVGCVVCCCYGCECGVTVPVLCCDGSGVVL